MKKVALTLSVAFLLSFGFSSCVKNWTCQCSQLVGGGTTTVNVQTIKATKKTATTTCETWNSVSMGGYTNCSIK